MNRMRLWAVAVSFIAGALLAGYLSTWAHLDWLHQGRSDFGNAYVAGQLWRDGHGGQLYDAALQKAYHDSDIAPDAEGNLPFLDAPTAAPLVALFTSVDIRTGWRLWSTMQLLLLAAALLVALRSARWRPGTGREVRLAAALAAAAGVGTYLLLIQGQWSGLLALSAALAHAAWRRNRQFTGGAVLAVTLLSIKPNLGLGVAAFMLGWRERRVLTGALVGASGVAVAWLAIAGPAGCLAFVGAAVNSTHDWPWSSMNGMSGLAASWFGESSATTVAGLIGCLAAAAAAYLLGRAFARGHLDLDATFAAVMALTLLASPHLYHHDLTLLAPAFVWAAAAATRRDRVREGHARASDGWPGAASLAVFGLWGLFALIGLQQLDAPLVGFPGRLIPWVLIAMAALAFVSARFASPSADRRRTTLASARAL